MSRQAPGEVGFEAYTLSQNCIGTVFFVIVPP